MTSNEQRAELQRRIWQIANDVRGSIDGWDFKQYVLGALFYRFISENFANYAEGGDDIINYASMLALCYTPCIICQLKGELLLSAFLVFFIVVWQSKKSANI